MIGSANSPLSMFTGGQGTGEAFQAALAQGTGPASALADALKGTVDRYHQVMQSQQENAYRTDQIKTKYDTLGQNRLEYEAEKASDAKAVADSTPPWAKNFDPSNPIMVPDGKGGKIPVAPTYAADGRVTGVRPINVPFNIFQMGQDQPVSEHPQSSSAAALAKLQASTDALTQQLNGNDGQGGQPLP